MTINEMVRHYGTAVRGIIDWKEVESGRLSISETIPPLLASEMLLSVPNISDDHFAQLIDIVSEDAYFAANVLRNVPLSPAKRKPLISSVSGSPNIASDLLVHEATSDHKNRLRLTQSEQESLILTALVRPESAMAILRYFSQIVKKRARILKTLKRARILKALAEDREWKKGEIVHSTLVSPALAKEIAGMLGIRKKDTEIPTQNSPVIRVEITVGSHILESDRKIIAHYVEQNEKQKEVVKISTRIK